jgi:hypothetical protein
VCIVWGAGIGISVAVAIWHMSLYSILLVVFSVYCINSEYLYFITQKRKNQLLLQLRVELEHIQNNYNKSEDVLDALYETAVNAPFPIKNHLLTMWNILNIDDKHINSEVERYNISAPLPYLTDLLACSKETSKYGDSKVTGVSNYVLKLTGIQNAVAAATRVEDEAKEKFSGQALVTIIPIYLKPIANWVVEQMFDVSAYFNGVYGIVTTIMVFIVSLCIYEVIVHKRSLDCRCARYHPTLQRLYQLPVVKPFADYMVERDQSRKNRIESKLHTIGESMTIEQFMTQRIIFAATGFILTLLVCIFIQVSVKDNILTRDSGISTKITEGATEEEEQDMISFIINTSEALKDTSIDDSGTLTLSKMIDNSGLFQTDTAKELVASEISERINTYQGAYIKFWYFLLAVLVATLCMQAPYLLASKNMILVQIRSNDEVMRFQTIISCMKDIRRGSTKETLEEMELSADIYRNSLTQCIDEYAADPMIALEHLQTREQDNPLMQQICTKFLRADRVGLQRAFANLEPEMEECRKTREQKYHFYIEQTTNLTFMIAFLPVLLVMMLELVLPMILAAMSQLSIMNNMLVQ